MASSKLVEDVNALIAQTSAEANDYSSCIDHPDNETHFTVASMLKDKDTYHQAAIAVFLMGIGSFLTFMVTASAPDYIEVVYPEQNLLYLLVSIYNTANFLGLIIMLSPLGTYISIAIRLQFGYVLVACFTFFLPAIPYLIDELHFQIICFLFVGGAVMGLCAALLTTSLFSFAAMLPPKYIITAVSGQSFAGIVSAIIRIVNKASFGTTEQGTQRSGIGCFVIAGCIQLTAAIMFIVSYKSQFVQQYMFTYWALRHSRYLFKSENSNSTKNGEAQKHSVIKAESNSPKTVRFGKNNSNPMHRHNSDYDYLSYFHSDFVDPLSSSNLMKAIPRASSIDTDISEINDVEMSIKTATTAPTVDEATGVPLYEIPITPKPGKSERTLTNNTPTTYTTPRTQLMTTQGRDLLQDANYMDVIKKIHKCLISIFIGYGGVYLVFPSVVVGLEFEEKYLRETHWDAVILYAIWTTCGWIGIYVAKKFECGMTYHNLWMLQLLWTCVMYALFLAADQKSIVNDVYIVAISSVTPLVFGFLSARTWAELSKRANTAETEIAQAISQLTLLSGISIGGWIAFGMNQLLSTR